MSACGSGARTLFIARGRLDSHVTTIIIRRAARETRRPARPRRVTFALYYPIGSRKILFRPALFARSVVAGGINLSVGTYRYTTPRPIEPVARAHENIVMPEARIRDGSNYAVCTSGGRNRGTHAGFSHNGYEKASFFSIIRVMRILLRYHPGIFRVTRKRK